MFFILFGCRHAEVEEDLSEFLNDGTWKRGYTTNRLVGQAFTHCRPFLNYIPATGMYGPRVMLTTFSMNET